MSEETPAPSGEGEPKSLPSKNDIRLWKRAIRERWPISDEMREIITDELFAVLVNSKSPRDKINASKVLLGADGLNVKRGSMIGAVAKSQQQPATNVSVNVGVQIVETDDWYGTKPATVDHVAQGNGSSANGVDIAGSIQGGGVWPALGQNGSGTNGHAEGPREPEGAEEGSD